MHAPTDPQSTQDQQDHAVIPNLPKTKADELLAKERTVSRPGRNTVEPDLQLQSHHTETRETSARSVEQLHRF